MFAWKKKSPDCYPETAEAVAEEAEMLFRSGRMHCAEAVLTALNNRFAPESGEVAHLAAAFGGGSGSGCQCGAVVGAAIGYGLILREKHLPARLAKELHVWFNHEFGSACCRIIRGEHRGICPELTGRVAGKAAQMLESTGRFPQGEDGADR